MAFHPIDNNGQANMTTLANRWLDKQTNVIGTLAKLKKCGLKKDFEKGKKKNFKKKRKKLAITVVFAKNYNGFPVPFFFYV